MNVSPPSSPRDVVGVQAGGVHHLARVDCLTLEPHLEGSVRAALAADDLGSRNMMLPSASASRCSVRTSDSASTRPEFGDHSAARPCTRLAAANESLVHDLQALDAVRGAEAEQRLELGHFLLGRRDDQFSAAIVRYLLLGAELVQTARPSTHRRALSVPAG